VNGAGKTETARAAPSVLVVAGEASGDRLAARIARSLQTHGVRCFGMGGAAAHEAGVELVADLRRSAAMGLTEVAARLPAVALAFARLVLAARDARPRAAVLVDYTEFNQRMGALLRRRGVPVLWCVAPQVWAWRPRRMTAIARALDRLAVILPFEGPLWRAAGVDAHYIGHPALDVPTVDRATAQARLGLGRSRPNVALLPGSRPHEVRRHTPPMLATLSELAGAGMRVDARLLVAASLDMATRRWLVARAGRAGVATVDVDADSGAAACLSGFDAALAASGTATLECALAGAPPVVVYRMSPVTAAVARRLVRTPFVALPNILLGSAVYPELLDRYAEPVKMARALASLLERPSIFATSALELRARLAWPQSPSPAALPSRTGAPPAVVGDSSAERAVSLLSDWLELRAPQCRSPKGALRTASAAAEASDPP
jgi:lipid-A-disaccharide synthase